MVFGPQMDIYKDPVVKIFPNILTFEGALGYGHAPAQFQTFFRKHGKTFWDPRSTFWPGDLFGVKNGPENSEFVTEAFCHGSSGEIPKPK